MENYTNVKANIPTTQPEYLSIATQFANEMCERFQPMEQNEILKQIYIIIKEKREADLIQAEKQFCYLKDSMDELNSF